MTNSDVAAYLTAEELTRLADILTDLNSHHDSDTDLLSLTGEVRDSNGDLLGVIELDSFDDDNPDEYVFKPGGWHEG